ncbi:MAG: biotin synthase BioB [Lentisphaeria bacterium]|nr:biotin synthase BioB [Lentisphaeria bacterium]NQZ67170.1 biotin synthase BioB [Lentisphaeria bacterium]
MNQAIAENVKIDWDGLAERAINKEKISRIEALAILETNDLELLSIINSAWKVRHHYFGKKVRLNMLMNAKSGHCPEDCGYCSQSKDSTAPIEKYTMLDKDTLVAGAREACKRKAGTYCIVCSGRGPTPNTIDAVVEAVKEIKGEMNLQICACLGLLKEGQAEALKEAGVDRYNHNINTSENHHEEVVKTHSYQNRVDTIESSKSAGISPCSGVIIGMGESHDDIVDMAYALRELDADSIPVNFLNSIDGTPMEGIEAKSPQFYLKVLALFRFICPDKEIRCSAGREIHLGNLQPMSLYIANSIFAGDYLTTSGQDVEADHKMIADLGLEIDFPEQS